MARVESPSSINTYKQCPRRYYYRYIEELPSLPSIHLIRGKAVHTTLEDFYDIDSNINTEDALRLHLFLLFDKVWNESQDELMELDMSEARIKGYYNESRDMLTNWFNRYKKKLRAQLKNGKTFSEAFEHLTPVREEEFNSPKHKVRGFIDVVFNKNGTVVIIDYKTSKNAMITEEYELQLGIYALMYEETHGVLPDLVGIDFLKHSEILIPVNEKLVENAIKNIEYVHSKTETTEKEDYLKKPGPLCKWSTGQCDYYDKCFK